MHPDDHQDGARYKVLPNYDLRTPSLRRQLEAETFHLELPLRSLLEAPTVGHPALRIVPGGWGDR